MTEIEKIHCHKMTHILTEPVNITCEQQKQRSAFLLVQFGQDLFVGCLDSIIPMFAIFAIPRL